MGEKHNRMSLDNSANIYAAARNRKWANLFRLSVTLSEPVDGPLLQSALNATVPRFPSMAARLCKGTHWYYIEKIEQAPAIEPDSDYPLKYMSFTQICKCAFRVLYAGNRFSVEFFHAITDGSGAMIFIKTLTAEYLTQKYGITIPNTDGVLCRMETPREEELEDSHLKYANGKGRRLKEISSYHLSGTKEKDGFIHNTVVTMSAEEALASAKSHNVSLTEFLTGIMIAAVLEIQSKKIPKRKKQEIVRVMVPINMRKLFDSKSLRNFTFYALPGVDPKMGEYSLHEVINSVHHQMRLCRTPQNVSAQISANVHAGKMFMARIMPLLMKDIALRAAFRFWGESTSCLSLSNLGVVQIPEEMKPYVTCFDFMLGVRARAPYNCGIVSYGDNLHINFSRSIVEPILENHFLELLHQQGLDFKVESNERQSVWYALPGFEGCTLKYAVRKNMNGI